MTLLEGKKLLITGVLMDSSIAFHVAKTAQQETAGDVAESELAKEFAAYADRQNRAGYLWLGAAVLLFATTVVVALTVLGQVGQAFDWYSLASHLLIALPCLGLVPGHGKVPTGGQIAVPAGGH